MLTATKRFFAHSIPILVVLLALVVAGAGLVAYMPVANSQSMVITTPTANTSVQPQPTSIPAPTSGVEEVAEIPANLATDPFIRTELFFGSERPNQSEVSKREFKRFLDEVVTPRFPDGLTVLTGFGQFREENGEIVQETSFVLVLLYPRETAQDSSAKIEELRTLYKERFDQESVLRVDDPRPVRVSF